MKYLEWNNVIINHFFNSDNEEKEVALYFSEDVIKEIGEENFPLSENGYVEDFFHALRIGVCGTQNNDYIQRILDLENRYSQGCRGVENVPFNYPPYFTYLLAFILPFTSGQLQEGFRMTNFHDIVKMYFESKQLSTIYERQIKSSLHKIDYLWKKIFDWLFETNNITLGYIEKIDNPAPNRKYVSKFEYHIIFRKEQEDKLSVIFDDNNILPNEPINESTIKQLLINHARELRLTIDTITKIRNNEYIGEKIVRRAFNYYKKWDGTNRYDYSKSPSDNTTLQRGFSRKRIVLCLNFNVLTQKIESKYFRIYSTDGLPEEYTMIDSVNKEYNNIEQCSQNYYYSNPVIGCFQNFNQSIELKDNTNRIKYSWKAKDFYLFKKDSQLNDWVEIPQIEFNTGKTLIITKKHFFEDKLSVWFEADTIPINHKKLYNDNSRTNLPADWLALTIEQITQYQHSDILELRTPPETNPKINFDKEFFFNACFFTDILPNVWVENCEVENCEIIAEYNDNTRIPLQKVEGSNKFRFSEQHLERERKNQEFKLKCENIEYTRFVKIVDFNKKKTNDEIKQIQPKRNLIGNTIKFFETSSDYFQGIEHCFNRQKINELKPMQDVIEINAYIFKNIKETNSYDQNLNYNKKHKGNILLNYISEKGKITKAEYDNITIRLLQNSTKQDNLKKQIRYSLYDLQNLGYVDYDAEQGIICVNKSSLVVKPTESGTTLILIGARDNKSVNSILEYAKRGSCYIDIQDDSSELLPQTILIKFKKCNHTIVNDLAKHFNLQFNHEEKLFTQFALANAHNLKEWEMFVHKTSDLNLANDFEGGDIFDIETLQFKEKHNNFDKTLALLQFPNINGYKTAYRLWYKSEAYHIAEQNYGVYLYLYLYRQIKTEQHLTEKDRGEINSYEYKGKEQSIKPLTNILLFDESKNWLGVPLNCALPKYFSIAFTLLSGKKPEIQRYNNRLYLIYGNVPFLFCNNSLVTTLQQQFDNYNKKQQIFK
ncbi:hypothetical protein EZS27_011193 [termite gut metagenome]|uniref:Uncharacterized protein n=1 Tax=termite gut metagenome TaxID=433724 RepID=A0A5J4S6D0_9ZZZZ